MRSILAALCLVVMLAATASVGATDFEHLYTPYGFRLPLLNKGDYVVSFSYHKNKSTSKYLSSPDDQQSEREGYDHILDFSGVLALSSKFHILGGLQFTPQYTSSEYDQISYIFNGSSTQIVQRAVTIQQQAKLSPSMTLVYRPTQLIEVHSSFSYYQRESKNIAPESKDDYLAQEDYSSMSFEVGITLTGEL